MGLDAIMGVGLSAIFTVYAAVGGALYAAHPATEQVQAGPVYEVTLKGEAPVRVTADGAGMASASSIEKAFNVPAAGVTLVASGTQHNELRVRTVLNEPVIQTFVPKGGGDGLQVPGVDTITKDSYHQLTAGQQLVVADPRCATGKGDVLVRITRIQ
jgi:hypothetical protein